MKAFAIFFDQPLSYGDGLILQEAILEERTKDQVPDVVLFLEHLPVITCGVRTKPAQILLAPDKLKKKGIGIVSSSRGGAATFHGPGQVVVYPIVKLGGATADVRGYLHNLEEVAIRTALSFGVAAYRREGMTGAWTDRGKLCAIGVRFKRWVTYHGLSFNVNLDLSGFSTIVPCGLAGERVVSLKLLLGNKCPSVEKARECLTNHFGSVCARDLTVIHRASFSPRELSSLLAMLR